MKTKRHIQYTAFLAIAAAMSLASCTDYLDKAPGSDISEETPYANFKNFQGFAEELYAKIPIESNSEYHQCWNYGDDEMWQPEDRIFSNKIDAGDFWGYTTCYYSYPTAPGLTGTGAGDRRSRANVWGCAWYAINKCNTGIANLGKFTSGTQEERDLIAGQFYFFRAWYHMQLMEWWGGMPYIDYEADGSEKPARLTYQECAKRCAEDFDRAAKLLPVDWDKTAPGKATLGKNSMRPTNILAYAYKGKALLCGGSPHMNKEAGNGETYNAEMCKEGADALGTALQLNDDNARYKLIDFDNYNDIFIVYNSSGALPGNGEAMMRECVTDFGGRWAWNQHTDYRPSSLVSSGFMAWPTANYVKNFGTASGYPIKDYTQSDATSGYDSERPFKNRDPRFYKIFMFDGSKYTAAGGAKGTVQLFKGGNETEANSANKANGISTGFFNTKFCQWDVTQATCRDRGPIVVLAFMRLADVYLMYAEATAAGYGSPTAKAATYSKTAVDAINVIRDRATCAHVPAEFTASNDKFMPEVYRERAVELAFEGFRFFDLRRWGLIDKYPYNVKTALRFDRANPNDFDYKNPEDNKVVNMSEDVILERHFIERNYWLPVPQNDTYINAGFQQNPGW